MLWIIGRFKQSAADDIQIDQQGIITSNVGKGRVLQKIVFDGHQTWEKPLTNPSEHLAEWLRAIPKESREGNQFILTVLSPRKITKFIQVA